MTDNLGLPFRNQPEQYLAALHTQPLIDPDLHIWRASLNGSPNELRIYTALLAPEEKARAERFYFERDRRRYIIGRGILRTLLGGYLEMSASEIAISYGPYGKPAVATLFNNKLLQFNLSNSNDQALFIFGWDRPLGIDLEHIRPLQDADDFAKHFFSERETKFINALPGDQKWNAFFKLWTCKEAYLKANGSGLTIPLNEAEISFDPAGSAKLTSIGGDSREASKWRLEIFNPTPKYQAALAVEGHARQLHFLQANG